MRLHRDAKTELLRSLPLFAGCTRSELAEISAVADEIRFEAGHVLAREGATGREFVVIAAGSASVLRAGSVIARLRSGDFFGEIALLTSQPRVASVVATSRLDALVVEGHAFLNLLERHPAIRAKVEQALAERTPEEHLGPDEAPVAS